MKLPELLAPVGSMDHLQIAINAGASSIYLSGKEYGARKFAENFTLNEIEQAVNTAHLYNVKVYVTVNTLIKEDEIENVLNYLNKLHEIGVDAVLVQDLGLVELINKHIPKLKIHASTQMNLENQDKIDYIESKGVKRIVLPREMRKKEIENIKTNMELEIFAHGALCFSYSGQCLMSSFKGGRSGNRGTCAQPCRQKYKTNFLNYHDYYLSPKDLCLINKLEEISKLNISCIKIEGRMRNKEYLAIVISEYRKALNKLKSHKKYSSELINLVFNRGFTEGQFSYNSSRSLRAGHLGLKIGKIINQEKNQLAIKVNDDLKIIPEKGDGLLIHKNKEDCGFEISKNPLLTTLNHYKKGKNKAIKDITRKNKVLLIKQVRENKRIPENLIGAEVFLSKRNKISKITKEIEHKGNSYIKSKLTLTFSVRKEYPHLKGILKLANNKEITAEVSGNHPFEQPLKKAVSVETIKKQLSKLDNYPFEIIQMNINYHGNLFIPLSEINKLRRDLLAKLENNLINSYKHEVTPIKLDKKEKIEENKAPTLSVYTTNLNHLKELKNVERVYLEIPADTSSQLDKINISYMVNFLEKALEISTNKDYELIWKWPDITHENLLKALNQVKGILNKKHIPIETMSSNFKGEYGSSALNIANSETVESLSQYKLLTLSLELRKKDYEDIIKNISDSSKVEIVVQGNVELMKTRQNILNRNESKKIGNNELILIDNKGNSFSTYKSISNEEITIINNEELSLLKEIPHLIDIGYKNFAIDARWKDNQYIGIADVYLDAINNGKVNIKKLNKYSKFNTKGNY
ncbi:putative protease YdcP precursor [Methanobrevibacter woesei]|uniref:Putative protease YdcP n=1 Tax=Methanobrevibacter woesei TaxID=190976 RepID=A0A2U1S8Z3_9EURY|nr:U32 family peptidase [Methanobrevibacter woesei]PWB86762.1 putative protease YdcP precursor [Methanobrevibacter woesei]